MTRSLFALLFVLTFSACANSAGTGDLDSEADALLGADQEEQTYEAQETLQTLQDRNLQERKSALQRQITEINR